jgi:hypothetical protein
MTLAALLFLLVFTMPVGITFAVLALRRRARRQVRTVQLITRSMGARAYAAFAAASPAGAPPWEELPERACRGWAAFTQGVDVLDAFALYAVTVRVDLLGRPLPPWIALNRAEQERYGAAFDALLDDLPEYSRPAA